MLLYALILTGVGLWNLLLPRRFFLVGSRWQFRDPERAEPSDTYVVVVRAGGVVFLVIAVILTIMHFSLQAEKETEESLESAWDVASIRGEQLQVIENPVVVETPNVEAALQSLSGERMGLPTWKTAVVGQDEVGNLGVTVHDGDLWMAAIAGSCEPAVLMLHETETSVTIAMTADSRPFGDFGYIPCFRSGYQIPTLDQLVIVRVPLSAPLGDREVIQVTAPERELNLPFPVLPGSTNAPETSTPTPTPTPTP